MSIKKNNIETIFKKLEDTAKKLKEYNIMLKKGIKGTDSIGKWAANATGSEVNEIKPKADEARKPSLRGRMVQLGETNKAKEMARMSLAHLKAQPKMKLTKEEMNETLKFEDTTTKAEDTVQNANQAAGHNVTLHFKHKGEDYSHTFNGLQGGHTGSVNTALNHLKSKLPGAAVSRATAVAVKPNKITGESAGDKIKI